MMDIWELVEEGKIKDFYQYKKVNYIKNLEGYRFIELTNKRKITPQIFGYFETIGEDTIVLYDRKMNILEEIKREG